MKAVSRNNIEEQMFLEKEEDPINIPAILFMQVL
jgi:hypothetical protein